MKYRECLSLVLYIFLSSVTGLSAKIVEISDLKDVSDIDCGDTLVLFDIHDTLVKHIFQDEVDAVKAAMKAGAQISIKDRHIKYRWINVIPTQDDTAEIVQGLQKRCSVLALTAAECDTRDYVFNQLFQVGIDFSGAFNISNMNDIACLKSSVKKLAIKSRLSCDVCFKNGVIFSGYGEKPEKPSGLEAFLKYYNLTGIKKIVLIDDSLINHEALQKWCDANKFDYLGFHYVPNIKLGIKGGAYEQ